MKVFVATKNLGKLAEMRAIFATSPLELATYDAYADPIEGETSYAENAELKARALFEQLRQAGINGATLADDSGLEVAALDGRPGVLSARYAGIDATWAQRRAGILRELAGVPKQDRAAKFCSAVSLVTADGATFAGYGEAHGEIAFEERGANGFGYDPIFVDGSLGRTYSEIDEATKNRISHRAAAARALLANLADADA